MKKPLKVVDNSILFDISVSIVIEYIQYEKSFVFSEHIILFQWLY
jgi:hypothetical protein